MSGLILRFLGFALRNTNQLCSRLSESFEEKYIKNIFKFK